MSFILNKLEFNYGFKLILRVFIFDVRMLMHKFFIIILMHPCMGNFNWTNINWNSNPALN